MARPRKPTAHLKLVGAFRKNPQRARDDEPANNGDVMLPPVPLSEPEREAWDFIVATAAEGVLTKMDSIYVHLCARALAIIWYGENVTISDMKTVGAMFGKLGYTPSERSNIIIPKKDKPNPYAAYKKA